jgi:hypothetical protein
LYFYLIVYYNDKTIIKLTKTLAIVLCYFNTVLNIKCQYMVGCPYNMTMKILL